VRVADAIGPDGCETAEALAMFVEGTLTAADRARVVSHLARCERCRETVAMASDAVAHVAAVPATVRDVRRLRYRGTIVGLALAASVAIAAVTYLLPIIRPAPYRELLTAAQHTRPVDGRISGLSYAAPSVTRGGNSIPAGNWSLLAAAAKVKNAAANQRSATNLHALGVAHLLLGEYDDAVRALSEASGKSSSAAIQSDLAAAYAARAARSQAAADYASALAAADRALVADPGLNEAYFNRALALEGLAMAAEAAAAWRTYLERDPTGAWAAEARERLARHQSVRLAPFDAIRASLEAALNDGDTAKIDALVGQYPQATRDYLDDDVLGRWAGAAEAGDQKAGGLLIAARRLATSFTKQGDDRTPLEILSRIDAAASANQLQGITELHRMYTEGKRLLAADRLIDAATVFRRCATTERDAHPHPLALECAYHATAPALNAGGQDGTRRQLSEVAAAAEAHGYRTLAGLARWRLALMLGTGGDLIAALGEYQSALAHFDAAGVTELSANVHSLMSEVLRILGDVDGAWQQHRAALAASGTIWSPRIRHQILVQAVLTSLDTDMPEVALDLTDTLIAEDRAWQHQPSLALAYAHRARALRQLARRPEALAALDEARQTIAGIPDADYQRRFDTELLNARLDVIGTTNPGDALTTADAALDNVRYVSATVRIPGLLFARGVARAALGQVDLAERDYSEALQRLESEHDRIASDSLRVSHLQRNFEVVRTFVDFLLLVRHDPERALATLEQSRGRWLLASVRGAGVRPSLPRDAIAALSSDTAIVYYGVLDSGVHAWVLTDRGVTYRRLAVSTRLLDETVRSLWTRLQSEGGDDRSLLTDLGDWLLEPLRDAIGTRTRLVFVPDGPIYNVPLAALIERASNRYLIDRVTVLVSPSLTLAQLRPGPSDALPSPPSVGIFGGNVAGRPILSDVPAEQQAIAAIYPSPLTQRYHGGKREFLTSIDHHDIVHFAGHATANLADPALSRLEFPGTGGLPTDDVLAADVTGLRLHRARVVVLAACRTSWGPNVAGEGTLSLAHAFLGAGVNAVLGSLWDVDDRSTRTLVTWMHEEMAHGRSLADALRTAQRRALGSSDPELKRPSRWAAFVASVRS
jgi:CHAT domain-containing protein